MADKVRGEEKGVSKVDSQELARDVWTLQKAANGPPGARAARRAMCTWGAARRWMPQKPAGRPGR